MPRKRSAALIEKKNQKTLHDSIPSQNMSSSYALPSGPSQSQPKTPRQLDLPRDLLAITLKRCREACGKSVYRLAEDSGVPVNTIWRIERGERQSATRETILLLSLAMVLDQQKLDEVVDVANEILDAAGLKMLRAPWEPGKTIRSPADKSGNEA